jgi:hypothetical protein
MDRGAAEMQQRLDQARLILREKIPPRTDD